MSMASCGVFWCLRCIQILLPWNFFCWESCAMYEMNRLKLETSGELPINLEESMEEYTSNKWKKNWKMMSTCYNRLDWESLGPWPTIYAQNLPGHWSCGLNLAEDMRNSGATPSMAHKNHIIKYAKFRDTNNQVALETNLLLRPSCSWE